MPRCLVCGTAFETKSALKQHRNATHLHPKHKYNCYKCLPRVVFKNKGQLKQHNLNVHRKTRERPDAGFARRAPEMASMLVHAGQQPNGKGRSGLFSCDVCAASWSAANVVETDVMGCAKCGNNVRPVGQWGPCGLVPFGADPNFLWPLDPGFRIGDQTVAGSRPAAARAAVSSGGLSAGSEVFKSFSESSSTSGGGGSSSTQRTEGSEASSLSFTTSGFEAALGGAAVDREPPPSPPPSPAPPPSPPPPPSGPGEEGGTTMKSETLD